MTRQQQQQPCVCEMPAPATCDIKTNEATAHPLQPCSRGDANVGGQPQHNGPSRRPPTPVFTHSPNIPPIPEDPPTHPASRGDARVSGLLQQLQAARLHVDACSRPRQHALLHTRQDACRRGVDRESRAGLSVRVARKASMHF